MSKIAAFLEILIYKDENNDIFDNLINLMNERYADKEHYENFTDTAVHQESFLNMKIELDQAKNNIAHLRADNERSFKTLKTCTLEVEVLKMRMSNKADMENVLNVQNQLEEYTPLVQFEDLMQSIPDFVRTNRFNKIIEKIVLIEGHLKDTAKTESIMKKLTELRNQLANRVNQTVTKEDFDKGRKEVQKQILKLEETDKEQGEFTVSLDNRLKLLQRLNDEK